MEIFFLKTNVSFTQNGTDGNILKINYVRFTLNGTNRKVRVLHEDKLHQIRTERC